MVGLILGVILQYMVSASLSCFLRVKANCILFAYAYSKLNYGEIPAKTSLTKARIGPKRRSIDKLYICAVYIEVFVIASQSSL